MTLLEIEAFLAVVKYGTLSAAAQNLYVTQPALTRRLQIMEQELGYPLLTRQKGQRGIQLTERGAKFYHIAWKWQRLWEETNSITDSRERESLSIAAVDAVNHNVFSSLFYDFTKRGYLLQLYNAFSEDTYEYMERGIYDLAFITLQDYTQPLPAGVQVRPAYAERFLAASFSPLPNREGQVSLADLREEEEIYIAWNKEFKAWHAEHFDEQISPLAVLEHSTLVNYFLREAGWAFVTYATGEQLRKNGVHVYTLKEAPPPQIIYYLVNGSKKSLAIQKFLECLNEHLSTMPTEYIQSFL